MEAVIDLILLFFAFSFLGWCMEVFLKYRQYRRFINRGFFAGPILPIYGTGAALITIAVRGIAGMESGLLATFLISFVICGLVEYFVSFFLEKKYQARWWDYSQKPMNLHGRVWIGNLILFGLGGLFIIEVADPLIYGVLGHLSILAKEILAAVLVISFITDDIGSHFVMKLVKVGIEQSEADNTEEIGREIRLLLSDKNIFYRRFADAYPDVIYRTDKVKARMKTLKEEAEKMVAELEQRSHELQQRLEEEKEQLTAALEPSGRIKNEIIENQQRLIELLYDEKQATEEMEALRVLIEEKRKILKNRRF